MYRVPARLVASRRLVTARCFSVQAWSASAKSSFFEPDPTLFFPVEPSSKDAQLRSDIRTMGSLLGKIIQQQNGTEIFDKVERMRHLAKVCLPMQGIGTAGSLQLQSLPSCAKSVQFFTESHLTDTSPTSSTGLERKGRWTRHCRHEPRALHLVSLRKRP